MRPVKFPKRRPDGSFCVELYLSIVTDDPSALAFQMTAWIEEWVRVNRNWECPMAKNVGGAFDFYDEFIRPPHCVIGSSGSLFLRVEGRPGAGEWWKDWILSRLMVDMLAVFKEIQRPALEKVRDCPEDRSTEPIA